MIIMKQGNTSRVDKGWERIQPILEKELPNKKEKRRALWLWMFPLMLIVAGLIFFLNHNQGSEKIEKSLENEMPIALQSNTPSANDKTSKKSPVQLEKKKEDISESTDQLNFITEETALKNDLARKTSDNGIGSSTVTIENTSRTKQKESNSNNATERNISSSADALAINLKTSASDVKSNKNLTPYEINTLDESVKINNSQPFLSELPLLSQIPLDEFKIQDNKINLEAAFILATSTVPAVSPLIKTKRLYPSLAISGFYAPQLSSLGLELTIGIEKIKNKWTYGANVGGGYFFDQANTTYDLDNNSRISQDTFFIPAGGSIPTSKVPSYQRYLKGGISAGYNITSYLTLNGQLGIEKYFLKSNTNPSTLSNTPSLEDNIPIESDTNNGVLIEETAQVQNADSSISLGRNWQPMTQVGLSYNLKSWSIETAYRINFRSLFNIDTEAYRGDKLFLSLKKQF